MLNMPIISLWLDTGRGCGMALAGVAVAALSCGMAGSRKGIVMVQAASDGAAQESWFLIVGRWVIVV